MQESLCFLCFLLACILLMCCCQVLDAIGLEERFKKALPLLTRQIEGLKLLQKTRKLRPDDDKRVSWHLFYPYLSPLPSPVLICISSLRCCPSVKAVCFPAVSSLWRRRGTMRMVMIRLHWRGRSKLRLCQRLPCVCVWRSSGGIYWSLILSVDMWLWIFSEGTTLLYYTQWTARMLDQLTFTSFLYRTSLLRM